MAGLKKIKNALVSVYYKDNLEPLIKKLNEYGVSFYSTGGTQKFIEGFGIPVTPVENLILGGRVKTLHPKIFGGILGRRELSSDLLQLEEYQIPEIDLVIVDLYPFEETLLSGAGEQEIIEKIDIGGVSLIRAAAKNYKDVVIVASREKYNFLLDTLNKKQGFTSLDDRKSLARHAFNTTSHYDTAIFNYFNEDNTEAVFKQSILNAQELRYGENPHQKGYFFGEIKGVFDILNGKELSYNNLLDADAAVNLIAEFSPDENAFAIIKHNNACGLAVRENAVSAWKDALAGDPVSAFGGIIISNQLINTETAKEINKIFFEIIIAPDYEDEALSLLKMKKNRIILRLKKTEFEKYQFRSILNGVLVQEKDWKTESKKDLKNATVKAPSSKETEDLLFANKIVKHTKSNTIVLAKNKQLLGSGTGQTSRVDALKHAIEKAKNFGFDLNGAVMSSDAFFPFPDCVEIAHKAGITAVVQPGGSIKDNESVDYCNKNNIAMVITGTRHFKH
jgi:phosphoribosylaminoimidazolecarboxamide formyltransferase / IMP cyclohydrolase